MFSHFPDDFWENSPWDDENHFWREKDREQFEQAARFPLAWQFSAITLRHGADTLYEVVYSAQKRIIDRFIEETREQKNSDDPIAPHSQEIVGEELEWHYDANLGGLYLMLYAFAIENVAKGILVMRSTEILDSSGKFKYRVHDLVKLVRDYCKVPLNAKEELALEKLSYYAVWRGRYPIPTNSSGWRLPPRVSEDGARISTGHSQAEYELISSLCDRLEDIFIAEQRDSNNPST